VILEVREIDTFYGDMQALRGVSLEVRAGEIVTVLGANGAGKSSLLKTIAGLLKPRAGSILFEGEPIDGLDTQALVRKGIVYVPEGRELFTNLSVRDNLLAAALHRPRSDRATSLATVLELFPPLKPRLAQRVGTMSGGEQQMVATGRALMSEPRLALIDEMSLGVAPIIVTRLFAVLEDMRKRGATIVLVEQNAKDALAVADRAYVLETGRVALSGTAQELLWNPQVRKAYLGFSGDA
jgi:branched-chain amino acid transport system ATP-binding protein